MSIPNDDRTHSRDQSACKLLSAPLLDHNDFAKKKGLTGTII